MKASEIKLECEILYRQIETAQNKLNSIRSVCIHPETFTGNYSYRIGSVVQAIICSDCGEVIKTV